jgi:hypothetical protein
MTKKDNGILYLDKELIQKSKAIGYNLNKTLENYMKHLMTQFLTCNSLKKQFQ